MERAELTSLIEQSAEKVGFSGPAVCDDLLPSVAPGAFAGAQSDGPLVMSFLRVGFLHHVNDVLNSIRPESEQGDFGDIDPAFHHVVKPLKRARYFVPSLGVRVAIRDLIKAPNLLDEARAYMRQKGNECIAEAKQLDLLYEAVTGAAPIPSNDDTPSSSQGAA